MKRNLFLRTDTLPEEIPLMFNNKNVYLPFTEKKMKTYFEIEEDINKKNTIPYFFHIPKNNGKSRNELATLFCTKIIRSLFSFDSYIMSR